MPATVGLHQAKTRSPELRPGLPCECQSPTHRLLPSWVLISRKLKLEAEWEQEPRHSDFTKYLPQRPNFSFYQILNAEWVDRVGEKEEVKRGRGDKKGRERKKTVTDCQHLFYYPYGCNSWGWIRLKPAIRTPTGYVKWTAGIQVLEHGLLLSGCYQELDQKWSHGNSS